MSNGDPKPDPKTGDLSSRIPPNWVFILCALVIAGSLVPALVVLLRSTGTNLIQARIAITLVCFSIACVIGLLFATSAQTTVKGTVGLISLAVVGPGAFFIACLLIYNYIFPENVIQGSDPLTLKRYGELVRDEERHNNWIPLSDWTERIGAIRPMFMRDEEKTLEQLLGEVYYHGDDNHKLKEPRVQTFFIYGIPVKGKMATLGLLRISGTRASNVPKVYFGAESTQGETHSVLLIRHESNAVDVKDRADGNWVEVDDDPVDCLTLAVYPDEKLEPGDIVSVDPIRHFRSGAGSASIELALLSQQPRVLTSLWEVAGASAPAPDAVPLSFRQYQSTPRTNAEDMAKQADMKWWLEYLDKRATAPDADNSPDIKLVKEASNLLKAVAPDLKFSNCLTHQALTDKTLYELTNVKNVVMVTFLWGASTPVTTSTRPNASGGGQ